MTARRNLFVRRGEKSFAGECWKRHVREVLRFLAEILADGLAPSLARWAGDQERRILKDGMVLPPDLVDFAGALGIENAGEIRFLEIDPIPLPVPFWMMAVAKRLGFPVFAPGAMAVGRGVFLACGQHSSLRHELVHVLQYQRLGGIGPFMREYVVQCLRDGYAAAGLEVEARAKGDRSNSASPGLENPLNHWSSSDL